MDKEGKRTYVINGISNNSSKPPQAIVNFAQAINAKLGYLEVKTVMGIYNQGHVQDLVDVGAEMINHNRYSTQVTNFILNDLKNTPMQKGDILNLIGYSGGGQIAFNVADKLKGKYQVDKLITLGSPAAEITRSNINQVTHFSSIIDPVKWLGWLAIPPITNIFDYNANEKYYLNVPHFGPNSYLNNGRIVNDVSNLLR